MATTENQNDSEVFLVVVLNFKKSLKYDFRSVFLGFLYRGCFRIFQPSVPPTKQHKQFIGKSIDTIQNNPFVLHFL